jgi:hypothetical protein
MVRPLNVGDRAIRSDIEDSTMPRPRTGNARGAHQHRGLFHRVELAADCGRLLLDLVLKHSARFANASHHDSGTALTSSGNLPANLLSEFFLSPSHNLIQIFKYWRHDHPENHCLN